MVLGLSLPPGITYVVAQGKISSNVLAWQLVLVSIAQGLLALLIVSLLRLTGYSHIFLPNWGLWIVAGLVVYVWVDMLNKFWGAILAGQQQIAIVNNSELVGRMTQFVMLFIVAGVLYLSQKTLTVSLLFLVSLSATILISILLLTSLGPKFEPSRDLSGLKAAFAQTRHSFSITGWTCLWWVFSRGQPPSAVTHSRYRWANCFGSCRTL
jgi:hypothetical protein